MVYSQEGSDLCSRFTPCCVLMAKVESKFRKYIATGHRRPRPSKCGAEDRRSVVHILCPLSRTGIHPRFKPFSDLGTRVPNFHVFTYSFYRSLPDHHLTFGVANSASRATVLLEPDPVLTLSYIRHALYLATKTPGGAGLDRRRPRRKPSQQLGMPSLTYGSEGDRGEGSPGVAHHQPATWHEPLRTL